MELLSVSLAEKRLPVSRRAGYTLLSFFIPFLIVTLGAAALLASPFGGHSLAITDARYYLNGELFFARLLRGGENFLYSFNNGLGENEWSVMSWGRLSPASALALFATRETIPAWFTWICAANISLCGMTMYILLYRLRGPKLSHLIFSTSYALMGFNVVNCYQTLFFIGPQMLPLVVLGLEQLLRGKSPLLYILSLAFCIFCNFYFGFMLCVVSILLFLTSLGLHESEPKERKGKLFLHWVGASVIAGLLAAPMWLPALKAFSDGGRLNQTEITEFTFQENMPFLRMFAKLFTGANSPAELVEGMPAIFCGILVVALTILFFVRKETGKRKKRAAALILVIYLLTFYISAFTLLMHGGTHTNWFPFRYSFVFSFFLICLAAEEFDQLDEITPGEFKKCGVILLVSAILVFSISYEFISGGCVLLDFLLLLAMWLAVRFYRRSPERAPKRVMTLFLLILVCGELYANFVISTKKVREWELDLDQYYENVAISGPLIERLKEMDGGFFRMEKDYSESGSIGADPYLYDYNGVSHSGPAERKFVHRGLEKLGVSRYDMRHWYSEGVPAATDTLLGLKYLISSRDLVLEKNYTSLFALEDKTVYRNPNALSVAILAGEGIQTVSLGNDVFINLNRVWQTMTGQEAPVFSEQEDVTFTLHSAFTEESVTSLELKNANTAADGEENGLPTGAYIEYSFVAEKTGPVYMFDTSIPPTYAGLAIPAITPCGFHEAGETVNGVIELGDVTYPTVEFFRGYCMNFVFATADNERLREYASLLGNREISFDVIYENDLRGSFTAEAGQRILFTIPWDEGWTCYIDGRKVPIDKTWDLFMSAKAPAGSHEYEMKFFPAWMDYGLALGAAALLGLILLLLLGRKRRVGFELVDDLQESPEVAPGPAAEETLSETELPNVEETL